MSADERETKKYKDAVELTISLERGITFGKSAEDVRNMNPKWLYSYLEDEWWREWNGLRQEWENPE